MQLFKIFNDRINNSIFCCISIIFEYCRAYFRHGVNKFIKVGHCYGILQFWNCFSSSTKRSSPFRKTLLPMLRFTAIHMFSIGLRSADWGGHCITFMLLSSIQVFTNLAVYLGSISCWSVHDIGISHSAYVSITVLRRSRQTVAIILYL